MVKTGFLMMRNLHLPPSSPWLGTTQATGSVKEAYSMMRIAWRLPSLIAPKILGDNRYLLEFDIMVVRDRIVEGGPWRHKGDTLIMVVVDDFARPSKVAMESINIWVRFYDLLKAMMKE
jgi:hypothetical protein